MRPQPRLRAFLTVAVLLFISAALVPAPALAQETAAALSPAPPAGGQAAAAPAASAVILSPAEDAYVAAAAPKDNFGTDAALRVAGEPAAPPGAAPTITATHASLLYFELGMLPPGTEVLAATLDLYQVGAPTAGGAQMIYAANSSWQEQSVTWRNAPKRHAGPNPIAFETAQQVNVSVEIDVTAVVQAWLASPNAPVAPVPNKGFVIVPAARAAPAGLAGAALALEPVERVYSSREGERQPQLRIEYRLPPVRVCNEVTDPCEGVPGAEVYDLDTGAVYVADAGGLITTANTIALGHRLWARAKVTEGQGAAHSTFYHTSTDPVQVQTGAFLGQGSVALPIAVTAGAPLHVANLNVSAQWYVEGNPALRDYLRDQIVAGSNFLYAFTDGRFALGKVVVRQGWEGWEEADLHLYANNTLRPKAIIGGSVLDATPDVSPTLPISYFPGPISLPSYWNRFGTPPGQVNVVGGQVVPPDVTRDDWGLALAHELGHWLLFLFDTYTGVDGTADGSLAELCTGSAMGDTYRPLNHGFVFDQSHWDLNCGGTEAHARLNGRTEWDTIAAWYPATIKPAALVPGPDAPPMTQVVFVPPQTSPGAPAAAAFTLLYVGGETASDGARTFLFQGASGRVIEQGRPPRNVNPPTIAPVGAAEGDRLCVYDINPAIDPAQARHQFGCEVIAAGDDTLAMTEDVAWQPEIAVEQTGAQQVRLEVAQAVAPGTTLKARFFPENGTLLKEVTLPPAPGGSASVTVDLGVPVPPLYVQLFVNDPVDEPLTRREVVADRGVGGGGAFGPRRLYGGAPVQSADGNATFVLSESALGGLDNLDPAASIAWQSMPGAPPLSPALHLLGQSYRLDAFPAALVEEGGVALQYPAPPPGAAADPASAGPAQAGQAEAAVYFWNGATWEKLPTVLAVPVAAADGKGLATAASRGPGVYAVLADAPAAAVMYLPLIQAQH